MNLDLLKDILIATVPLLVIFPSLFAFTTWVERKALARIQNRRGPNRVGIPCTRISLFGLGQPAADGIKMIFKEDIVPRGADRLFHLLAPILALIPAMMVLCFLPLEFPFWNAQIKAMRAFALDSAIVFFFAVTGLGTLAVFMAGWPSRNKYALLGGMRAIAQMISYEIPLVLSAVIVVMLVGSLNAADIVREQRFIWFVFTPWGFTAFVIFFICALAETNRSPFDLPEAESEIVAGYFTEYSGFKFALFFLGEYIAIFAISGLAVTLFLGGGNGPGAGLHPWVPIGWFLAKVCILIALMIWLRGTLPRLRVDQLMSFAWKFLLPLSLLNILITGAALHLLAAVHQHGGGQLDALTDRKVDFNQIIEAGNPWVIGGLWVGSLLILYVAARGLDNLTRSKVRPREYKYAE